MSTWFWPRSQDGPDFCRFFEAGTLQGRPGFFFRRHLLQATETGGLVDKEGGASVIVIEKMDEENHAWAGCGFGPIHSQWLKEQGSPEVDPVEVLNDWQLRGCSMSDPTLVMKYLKNCGDTFDWFISPASMLLTSGLLLPAADKARQCPKQQQGFPLGRPCWFLSAISAGSDRRGG